MGGEGGRGSAAGTPIGFAFPHVRLADHFSFFTGLFFWVIFPEWGFVNSPNSSLPTLLVVGHLAGCSDCSSDLGSCTAR